MIEIETITQRKGSSLDTGILVLLQNWAEVNGYELGSGFVNRYNFKGGMFSIGLTALFLYFLCINTGSVFT